MSTRGAARHVVGTIVARNYTAYAQVLQDSVLAAHPDVAVVTLLIDGTDADRSTAGLAEVMLLDDLALPPDELEPMVLMYDVMELATAVKPAFLRALLARGYAAAAYLDPDVWVRSSLAQVFEAAEEHGVALTPHTRHPMPRDGLEIAERTIMHAGIFNLGFIAVAPAGAQLLDWWHERLRTDAVIDFDAALFTDQRWLDWAPALWRPAILTDPGLNVAYWNIHERPVTRGPDGVEYAGGSPLRFVHFSGFQADQPWTLSRFTRDRPRVLLQDEPVLADLHRSYGAALADAAHAERRRTPYGHATLPGGLRPTAEMRRVYRDALLGTVPFTAPPTRPLTAPEDVAAWFTARAQVTAWVALAPVDLALWRSQPDLRAEFPDPFGRDARDLAARLDAGDAATYRLEAGLAEAGPEVPADTPSWSVVAFGDPEPTGEVAELARRLGEDLVAGGVGAELVERLPAPARTPAGDRPAPGWRRGAGPATSRHPRGLLVVVDAEQLSSAGLTALAEVATGPRVALWLTARVGEVAMHQPFLDAFDAVWVIDPAVADAVRAVSDVPVTVIRPPARAVPTGGGRVRVEVDATDWRALEPAAAAVAAYVGAVGEDAGTVLEVVPRYRELVPGARQRLAHEAAGRPDVRVTATPEPADVVVSLAGPRAVGLDLVDAVAAGATVVAAVPPPDEMESGWITVGPDPEHVGAALRDAVGQSANRPDRAHPSTAPTDVAALLSATPARPGRAPLPEDSLRRQLAGLTAELARVDRVLQETEQARTASEAALTDQIATVARLGEEIVAITERHARQSDTATRQAAAIDGLIRVTADLTRRESAAQRELAALRSTRLFRWSAAPRSVWGRVRSAVRR